MGHREPLLRLVPDAVREVRQEAERDVGGLVVRGVAARDVPAEGAQGGVFREDGRLLAARTEGGGDSGEETRGGRLDVALDSRHLPGEEEPLASAASRRWARGRAGRVHVGVAVDHPVADELGALEAGDHPEDALLLAPLELGLEAHDRPVAGGEVVLPQLHDGVRAAARCAGPGRGRPASSVRSEACPRPATRSPRRAGSPRRRAPSRSRGRSRTRRWMSAARKARYSASSSGQFR